MQFVRQPVGSCHSPSFGRFVMHPTSLKANVFYLHKLDQHIIWEHTHAQYEQSVWGIGRFHSKMKYPFILNKSRKSQMSTLTHRISPDEWNDGCPIGSTRPHFCRPRVGFSSVFVLLCPLICICRLANQVFIYLPLLIWISTKWQNTLCTWTCSAPFIETTKQVVIVTQISNNLSNCFSIYIVFLNQPLELLPWFRATVEHWCWLSYYVIVEIL